MPLEVALPKGRVMADTRRALSALGVHDVVGRRYRYEIPDDDIVVRLIKLQDIAGLVGAGVFHFGVAPDEWIEESQAEVVRVIALGWYRARVSLIGCADREARTDALTRIVTEYPHIARDRLADRFKRLTVQQVHGSTEAFLPDHADFVVDCIETGATLRANGLVEVDRLMDCDVHLIAHPDAWDPQCPSPAAASLLTALTTTALAR